MRTRVSKRETEREREDLNEIRDESRDKKNNTTKEKVIRGYLSTSKIWRTSIHSQAYNITKLNRRTQIIQQAGKKQDWVNNTKVFKQRKAQPQLLNFTKFQERMPVLLKLSFCSLSESSIILIPKPDKDKKAKKMRREFFLIL